MLKDIQAIDAKWINQTKFTITCEFKIKSLLVHIQQLATQKIIVKFKNDGLIENKYGSGKKGIPSDAAKRKIMKEIKIDPKVSAVQLVEDSFQIVGRSIKRFHYTSSKLDVKRLKLLAILTKHLARGPSTNIVQHLFQKFRNGDESLEDEECPAINGIQLKAIIEADKRKNLEMLQKR
ncbi:hypothetical protein TNIN_103271 [Trichonephila inaurata madagascariensis]|uniref:Uncharacterized protein n=1 Tax=Trichonephila inaurata madagascariensis TaxID=2747483 RepID=A0A8X6IBI2_9ARAC|nr:hypothetical protein TNIN_103271 [Trichonephila inaurata madagascariensis]